MFLRRIPYQSVERRRIHHWLLLAAARGGADRADRGRLRAAVLHGRTRSGRGGGDRRPRGGDPARSLGQHGLRRPLDAGAGRGPRASSTALGGDDRATLVLFGEQRRGDRARDVGPRPARRGDRRRDRVRRARRATARAAARAEHAQPVGPPRKEAVLISDFQKTGWARREDVHLPEGTTMHPVSVADLGDGRTCAVSSVTFARRAVLRRGARHA